MLTRARTMLALGLRNVARVATYRGLLRAGLHPAQRLGTPPVPAAPFFDAVDRSRTGPEGPLADPLLQFGWFSPPSGTIPDWQASPLLGTRATGADAPWWTTGDFDPAVGDIKTVWEASRFDWVVTFAQRARRGEDDALATLDAWLADWLRHDPPYRGVNWKCGQEASVRLLHLAVAALVLGHERRMTPGIRALVRQHLDRIAPTMAYAMGQANNHGTSEAAALLVGGSWLVAAGHADGARFAALGRQALEERVAHLFAEDGGFSQYSVNYHRLALDTCSVAEAWRRALDLPPFAATFRARLSAATEWLGTLVDPADGDAPNLGHNDGANLLRLTDAPYRDHRPAVRLAGALFQDRDWFAGDRRSASHLGWLRVSVPAVAAERPRPRMFDDGGLAVLHRGEAMAVLRYPRHRFRPAHADPLHVDLRVSGESCLRDGGTFSYAQDPEVGERLAGIEGHNTVQFDGRQPMPRLGRFLWGDWLQVRSVTAIAESTDGIGVEAAYVDREGAAHRRRVVLGLDAMHVADVVGGFAWEAVLRWRLRPGAWHLEGDTVTDGRHRLRVTAQGATPRLALVEGFESRHYLQRTTLPVLEVRVDESCLLHSEYRWGA